MKVYELEESEDLEEEKVKVKLQKVAWNYKSLYWVALGFTEDARVGI